MAFTAKILSWRFCHLNIVGCLLKRRPTKPRPCYAPGERGREESGLIQIHSLLSLLLPKLISK